MAVAGGGVTVNTVVVSSSTTLTANFVLDVTATTGGRAVTVTTAAGTSGLQTFTVSLLAPTLTNVAPNQGTRVTTIAVTLFNRHEFRRQRHDRDRQRYRRDSQHHRRGQQYVEA